MIFSDAIVSLNLRIIYCPTPIQITKGGRAISDIVYALIPIPKKSLKSNSRGCAACCKDFISNKEHVYNEMKRNGLQQFLQICGPHGLMQGHCIIAKQKHFLFEHPFSVFAVGGR